MCLRLPLLSDPHQATQLAGPYTQECLFQLNVIPDCFGLLPGTTSDIPLNTLCR